MRTGRGSYERLFRPARYEGERPVEAGTALLVAAVHGKLCVGVRFQRKGHAVRAGEAHLGRHAP